MKEIWKIFVKDYRKDMFLVLTTCIIVIFCFILMFVTRNVIFYIPAFTILTLTTIHISYLKLCITVDLIFKVVEEALEPEAVMEWFLNENALLGHKAPIFYLLELKMGKVYKAAIDLRDGIL